MRNVIYDLEIYPNFFCGYFGDTDTRKCWHFEISDRKDEREHMIELLRDIVRSKGRLVGFNVLGYDSQILQFILKNQKCTNRQIYNQSSKIINATDEERFKILVPEWKLLIPHVDLYKIWHLDNAARRTSLKALEFAMRSDNIEDLPYPPDKKLTDTEKDEVLAYNKQDMIQTFYFYQHSLDQIRFREKLTEEYGRNFINYSDAKIGKQYFTMKLEENIPGSCFDSNRKPRQTKRDSIPLSNCILPYIQFDRPEFQGVKDWLSKQVITQTKGVFNDILEPDLGSLANHAKMRTKQKKYPTREDAEANLFEGAWIEDRQLKSGKISNNLCWNVADNLNTFVDGFQVDYGVGGVHGSVENCIVESSEDRVIVSMDVSSLYPSIAIANRLYPEHLGEDFCDIYADVFNQRKQYPKGTPENAIMKLALNAVYGSSNDKFSVFYDPMFTMSITINGQLLMSMLVEKLLEVESIEMLMLNTDGLEFIIDRDKAERAYKVCSDWESITGLTLEYGTYNRMAIANCNNYLAIDEDGKVKQKGAYQYDGMDWWQNQSMLVVAMAAEHVLIYDGNLEKFIYNHDNIYDFVKRVKVPRTSRLVGVDEDGEHLLQNITRYYVSNEGVSLVKIMPALKEDGEERRIGVESSWKVKACNNIKNYDGDINYDYYVNECKKLVNPLLTTQ